MCWVPFLCIYQAGLCLRLVGFPGSQTSILTGSNSRPSLPAHPLLGNSPCFCSEDCALPVVFIFLVLLGLHKLPVPQWPCSLPIFVCFLSFLDLRLPGILLPPPGTGTSEFSLGPVLSVDSCLSFTYPTECRPHPSSLFIATAASSCTCRRQEWCQAGFGLVLFLKHCLTL